MATGYAAVGPTDSWVRCVGIGMIMIDMTHGFHVHGPLPKEAYWNNGSFKFVVGRQKSQKPLPAPTILLGARHRKTSLASDRRVLELLGALPCARRDGRKSVAHIGRPRNDGARYAARLPTRSSSAASKLNKA